MAVFAVMVSFNGMESWSAERKINLFLLFVLLKNSPVKLIFDKK